MTPDEEERIARELWAQGVELEEQGDFDAAAKYYQIASSMGFTPAKLNLANLLDDKLNARDPQEAVRLYKEAVAEGDAGGAWNLAMHYRNLGDNRWGLHWLQKAAQMGDESARIILSKMLKLVE